MRQAQDLFQHALTVWDWQPSILIGLFIWQAGYLWLTGSFQKRARWKPVSFSRKLYFSFGTIVAFLALVSPLDYISDNYLFSAHMLQHLLLIMIAPPLWLFGLPGDFFDVLTLPDFVKLIQ